MDVYLYNNTKRLNSTALPPLTSTKVECTLKENCSFLSPVLKLRSNTKPDANYMSFEGRYYWITDIISLANNLWQITGQVDVLATFRGHIFNTSAFVLYDSTPNTQLPDTRLAIETDCDTYTATASMPWYYTSGDKSGTYLIATTGEEDTIALGIDSSNPLKYTGSLQRVYRNGTGVYAIPQSSLQKIGFDFDDFLLQFLAINADVATRMGRLLDDLQNHTPTSVEDAIKYFISALINANLDMSVNYPTRIAMLIAQNLIGGGDALKNVKASYWLPFNLPNDVYEDSLPAGNKLALGTYTDIVPDLKRVKKPVITSVDVDVNIPWHFNDWRDVSCTEIMLYIPLIGCVNIPPECVKGNDTLNLRFSLNIYSGELACEIRCNNAQLGTYGANAAMNILIGDSNVNMGGAVNTVLGAVTKNYASVASGAVETMAGMNTSVGGIGGGAGTGLTDSIVCTCRCHETSQEPNDLLATIGTPTRQLKTLSSSLGYVQCMNAQCSGTAVTGEPYPTQTELNEINNYLNTGVYLE